MWEWSLNKSETNVFLNEKTCWEGIPKKHSNMVKGMTRKEWNQNTTPQSFYRLASRYLLSFFHLNPTTNKIHNYTNPHEPTISTSTSNIDIFIQFYYCHRRQKCLKISWWQFGKGSRCHSFLVILTLSFILCHSFKQLLTLFGCFLRIPSRHVF